MLELSLQDIHHNKTKLFWLHIFFLPQFISLLPIHSKYTEKSIHQVHNLIAIGFLTFYSTKMALFKSSALPTLSNPGITSLSASFSQPERHTQQLSPFSSGPLERNSPDFCPHHCWLYAVPISSSFSACSLNIGGWPNSVFSTYLILCS